MLKLRVRELSHKRLLEKNRKRKVRKEQLPPALKLPLVPKGQEVKVLRKALKRVVKKELRKNRLLMRKDAALGKQVQKRVTQPKEEQALRKEQVQKKVLQQTMEQARKGQVKKKVLQLKVGKAPRTGQVLKEVIQLKRE
jgi:hypothetical protein